jgi:hypothetical protein
MWDIVDFGIGLSHGLPAYVAWRAVVTRAPVRDYEFGFCSVCICYAFPVAVYSSVQKKNHYPYVLGILANLL